MTWEWSHAPEAYDHARDELAALDHDILAEIAAEWATYKHEDESTAMLDLEFYRWNEVYYLSVPDEILVRVIWDQMAVLRSCTNGGHHLWACPYGCHKVSVG